MHLKKKKRLDHVRENVNVNGTIINNDIHYDSRAKWYPFQWTLDFIRKKKNLIKKINKFIYYYDVIINSF